MENFKDILLHHFEKYPLMTPKDAVKLCYQSAYGCGHMVKSEKSALSMLKNEMDSIKADSGTKLIEYIGGGYVRLDLYAAKAAGISAEKICKIFVESANSGEKTELLQKMEILEKLSKEEKTPFSEKELSEYLSAYNGEIVSHSEEYKKAYAPAYRVVLESLAENLQ